MTELTPDQTHRRRRAVLLIALCLPIGAAVALALQGLGSPWAELGRGGLVSVAALAVGALLGFLFGIPRTLQHERPTGGHGGAAYGVNTNLEQISDWLTKILVGVGLVQFAVIGRQFGRLVSAVGEAFGGGAAGRLVAGTLMVAFLLSGFLVGYVATRTTLTHIFAQWDVKDIRQLVERQIGERLQRDGDAMRLVIQQLDDDEPETDETALRKALGAASPAGRANVLLLADDLRRHSWRDPAFRGRVSRTVPIFRALTELGPGNHRYWGALGFAYKDAESPNDAGALIALTRAIECRGDARTTGKEFYEFARALVRLRLLGGGPDDRALALIAQDVGVAWRNDEIRRHIQTAIDKAPGGDSTDRENRLLRPYLPVAEGAD
ncbi:hypothetical protein AB0M43_06655 [Longispora sp. NPDC051575]|uniref:hypothetical protein n=1 Tax=Longispora sp. NPDC051575 TaxID=3154943 RepID=UPI00342300A4